MQVSLYDPDEWRVKGLAPRGMFCQLISQTQSHCQPFLSSLASNGEGEPGFRTGCCLPGACTVAVPLDCSDPQSPVVMGCFISKALGKSEELLRTADRLQLDSEALLAAAESQIRHPLEQAGLLADVLANIVREHFTRDSESRDEVESLSRNLAETYEELSFIYRLNNAMNITAEPKEYFRNVAEDLCDLLGVRTVLVVLSPESLPSIEKKSSIISSGPLPRPAEEIVEALNPRTLAKDGCVVRRDSSHCPAYVADDPVIGPVLIAPIMHDDRHLGTVLALQPEDDRKFDNIDATRLASVANSAAAFLENFRLYGSMRQLFFGSLQALTSSIDAKDPYTCGHSERVALISKRLMELLGMPSAEAERVYLCGLLHDIGKIGVPEAVLRKPGKLTSYEYEIIKKHPVIGSQIIGGIPEMEDLIPAVLYHHERMDGKGYPDGLADKEIPFRARVLCVADCVDAMTSDRPYRKALPAKLAESEIVRCAGTQFDPDLVEGLLKMDISEFIDQLRTEKTGFAPEDIYQAFNSPSSEVAGR